MNALMPTFALNDFMRDGMFEAVRDEFECRPMPETTLKGKTKTPAPMSVSRRWRRPP